MSMSKKDFIALADAIRDSQVPWLDHAINDMADFCKRQNPNFKRERWLDYIAGKCGKNGGSIKCAKGANSHE